jgi:3-hydroxy-9,10-secoandrosta-1,3,5(10)-triene-9,17-dione monooxygenase reductase component
VTAVLGMATAASFREAMSRHASGVVVVSHPVDGRPWGTTVTSFASVSDAPPTVLVALRSDTTSASAICDGGQFGVSVLGSHQLPIARHCAAAGGLKFLDRFPSIERHSLAHLHCVLLEAIDAADHVILVGSVTGAATGCEGAPLVYHRRQYGLRHVA